MINFEVNNISSVVKAHNCAVTDEVGEVHLAHCEYNLRAHAVRKGTNFTYEKFDESNRTTQTIPANTLDNIFDENQDFTGNDEIII
jgi:hypothetical protein